MARSGDNMLRRLRFMMSPQFLEAASQGIFEAADAMRAEAHHSIVAGSTSSKNRVASKPGEPPNNDSGFLASNIEVSRPSPFTARVTSHAPYSAVHEFGSSTHPARPFMRPARDKVQPEAERLLEQQIAKARRKFRRG